MKKKLVQILMLLVATVSIGAFVSCKDTNEDLYTDLREAVGDVGLNGNLADRIKKLESDLETYKCACGDLSNPNSLGSRVQIIENIIKGLTGGSGSGSDLSIPGDLITIGGGTSGQNGISADTAKASSGLGNGTGATQTSGAAFGVGGNGAAGGGGGWYGGTGSSGYNGTPGGGGGSGWIGGVTNGTTIAGNAAMPTHDGTSTMTGNSGNGYAKITLISY